MITTSDDSERHNQEEIKQKLELLLETIEIFDINDLENIYIMLKNDYDSYRCIGTKDSSPIYFYKLEGRKIVMQRAKLLVELRKTFK